MKKAPSFAVTVPGRLSAGYDEPKDDSMSSSHDSVEGNGPPQQRSKRNQFNQELSPNACNFTKQRANADQFDSPPREKVTAFKHGILPEMDDRTPVKADFNGELDLKQVIQQHIRDVENGSAKIDGFSSPI